MWYYSLSFLIKVRTVYIIIYNISGRTPDTAALNLKSAYVKSAQNGKIDAPIHQRRSAFWTMRVKYFQGLWDKHVKEYYIWYGLLYLLENLLYSGKCYNRKVWYYSLSFLIKVRGVYVVVYNISGRTPDTAALNLKAAYVKSEPNWEIDSSSD